MSNTSDFHAINSASIGRLLELLRELLPDGWANETEYVVARSANGDARWLKIDLKTGCWSDEGAERRGDDVVSLVAHLHNLDRHAAAAALADRLDPLHTPYRLWRGPIVSPWHQLLAQNARRSSTKSVRPLEQASADEGVNTHHSDPASAADTVAADGAEAACDPEEEIAPEPETRTDPDQVPPEQIRVDATDDESAVGGERTNNAGCLTEPVDAAPAHDVGEAVREEAVISLIPPSEDGQVTLDEIARRIRGRMQRTLIDIIEIGRDLIQAKAQLGHGKFGTWLNAEFSMTPQTAGKYMNVAQLYGGKLKPDFNLPLSTAYLLAAPSTPKEIVDRVAEEFERGEQVDARALEREIRDARREAREGAAESRLGQRNPANPVTKEEIEEAEEEEEPAQEGVQIEARGDNRIKDAIETAVSIILRLNQPELDRLREALEVDNRVALQLGGALRVALFEEAER